MRPAGALLILAAGGLVVALVTGATAFFNVLVFLVFAALWLALVAALAFRPITVDQAWESLAHRPLAVEAIVWLLLLPIMVGLWVWRRSWVAPLRLVLLLSIAGWNLFLFFPRS
jgi:hypothetical protein